MFYAQACVFSLSLLIPFPSYTKRMLFNHYFWLRKPVDYIFIEVQANHIKQCKSCKQGEVDKLVTTIIYRKNEGGGGLEGMSKYSNARTQLYFQSNSGLMWCSKQFNPLYCSYSLCQYVSHWWIYHLWLKTKNGFLGVKINIHNVVSRRVIIQDLIGN